MASFIVFGLMQFFGPQIFSTSNCNNCNNSCLAPPKNYKQKCVQTEKEAKCFRKSF